MHTGDMMARKGLPFIDSANTNGSATEFGATLLKAVDASEMSTRSSPDMRTIR